MDVSDLFYVSIVSVHNSGGAQKKEPYSPTKYYADYARVMVDRDMNEREAEERMDSYRHYVQFASS